MRDNNITDSNSKVSDLSTRNTMCAKERPCPNKPKVGDEGEKLSPSLYSHMPLSRNKYENGIYHQKQPACSRALAQTYSKTS